MSNSSSTSYDLVSNQQRLIFQWVLFSFVSEVIDIFGTVANTVNIICFVKQGFKNAVNISLLGLAVSDLGALIPLIWTNICFSPWFNDMDLPFEPLEIQYLTGSGLHVTFARVTGCITAFITLERCLCITMPLKVKRIVTPQRVCVIIILVFIVVISNAVPIYCVNIFGEKLSPLRNKSIIGLVFRADRDLVEGVAFAINTCFVQLSAFIVVIVCTILLVVSLRNKTKWRQASTSAGNSEKAFIRDEKVTKMVVAISACFVSCFMPVCLIQFTMIFEPGLSIQGKYSNLFISLFSICFVLESVNSSINIFIYYQMSSKYRSTMRKLFARS